MSSHTRSPFAKGAPAPQTRRWPGLEPYTEADAERFFGRREEITDLSQRVERRTLTVLFAQSGLGKTSVLRAGLFPTLRKGKLLPIYVRLDHGEGTASLVQQVFEVLREHLPTGLAAEAAAPPTLWEWFHDLEEGLLSPRLAGVTPVLVFDQFEEIFTIGARSEDQLRGREEFLTQLADLAENRMPAALERRLEDGDLDPDRYDFDRAQYRVLLALREDYLSYLDREKARIPSLMQNRMPLDRLSGLRALEVVTGPAPDLVTAEVAEQIVRFVAGEAQAPLESFHVEPPLLSLVCQRLDAARGTGPITSELLTGKREEILTGYYEECFAGLPAAVRTFVEDELVTESGHRESIAAERAELEIGADAIQHLVNHRLLHTERRGGLQRLELTHDILAKLVVASRTERRGRDQEAAQSAAQTERLRRIRKLLLGAVAALIVVVALPLTVLAVRASWIAKEQAALARQSAEEAAQQAQLARKAEAAAREAQQAAASEAGYFYAREALNLAARQAETVTDVPQPLPAWALLVQGLEVAGAEIPAARLALLERLLPAPRMTVTRRHTVPGGLARFAASRDGSWAAALRPDGRVVLWSADAASRSEFLQLGREERDGKVRWAWGPLGDAGAEAPPAMATALAFGRVGGTAERLVVATADRRLRLLALPGVGGGEESAHEVELPAAGGLATVLQPIGDGQVWLLGTSRGIVYRWTPTGSEAGFEPLRRSTFLDDLERPEHRVEPRGRYALVASVSERDRSARRWQWQELRPPYRMSELEVPVSEAAGLVFEEGGERFLVIRRGESGTADWRVTIHRADRAGRAVLTDQGEAGQHVLWQGQAGAELTWLGGMMLEPGLLLGLGSQGRLQLITLAEAEGGAGASVTDRSPEAAAGAGRGQRLTAELEPPAGRAVATAWAGGERRFAVLHEPHPQAQNHALLIFEVQRSGEGWQVNREVISLEGRFEALAFAAGNERLLLRRHGLDRVERPGFTHEVALAAERKVEPLDPATEEAEVLRSGRFQPWVYPVLDLAASAISGTVIMTTPGGVEGWHPGGQGEGWWHDWAPRGYQSGFLAPDGLAWRMFRRDDSGDREAMAALRWNAENGLGGAYRADEAQGTAPPARRGAAWAFLPQGAGWLQGTETGSVLLTLATRPGAPAEELRLPAEGLQRERIHGIQVTADGAAAWVVTDRGSVVRLALEVEPDDRATWRRDQPVLGVVTPATADGWKLGVVYERMVEWLDRDAVDLPGQVSVAPGRWAGQGPGWIAWSTAANAVVVTDAELQPLRELVLPEGGVLRALDPVAGRWLVEASGRLVAAGAAGELALAGELPGAGRLAGWGPDGGVWWLAAAAEGGSGEGELLAWSATGERRWAAPAVRAVALDPAAGELLALQRLPEQAAGAGGESVRLLAASPGAAAPTVVAELDIAPEHLAVWPDGGLLAFWGDDLGDAVQFWSRAEGTVAWLPQALGQGGWLVQAPGGDWVTAGPGGVDQVYRPWQRPPLETLKGQGGFDLQRVALQSMGQAAHQRNLLALCERLPALDEERAAFLETLAHAKVRKAAAAEAPAGWMVDELWADLQAPWAAFLARNPEPTAGLARRLAAWQAAVELPELTAQTDVEAWWAQLEPWGKLGAWRAIGPLQAAIRQPGLQPDQRRAMERRLLLAISERLNAYGGDPFQVDPATGAAKSTGSTDLDAEFAADWRQLVMVMNTLYPWAGVLVWETPDDYPDLSRIAAMLPRPEPGQSWLGQGPLDLLEWEVRLHPANGEYWNSLGVSYGNAGRMAECLRAYELAVAAPRVSAFAVGNLVQRYLEEGRLAEALAMFERLEDADFNEYARRRQAELFERLDRDIEAEAAWRKVLASSPEDLLAKHGLVRVLIRLGRTAEALALIEEYRASQPAGRMEDHLDFFWGDALDDRLARRGLELADQAIARGTANSSLLQHRGKFRFELGDLAGARSDWQQALELGDASGRFVGVEAWRRGALLTGLGEVMAQEGDWLEAIRVLDEAIAALPDQPAPLLQRAKVWQRMGRWEEALASVRAARALKDDEYVPAEARLLWLRNGPDDRAAARALLEADAPAVTGSRPWRAVEAMLQAQAEGRLAEARVWAERLRSAAFLHPRARLLAEAVAGAAGPEARRLARERRQAWPAQAQGYLDAAVVEAMAAAAGAPGAARERAVFFLVEAAIRGLDTAAAATGPGLVAAGLADDPRWQAWLAVDSPERRRSDDPGRWLALLDLLATLPAGVLADPAEEATADWSHAVQRAIEQAWRLGERNWAARAARPEWAALRAHPALQGLLADPEGGLLATGRLQEQVRVAVNSDAVDRSQGGEGTGAESEYLAWRRRARGAAAAWSWTWDLLPFLHPDYFNAVQVRVAVTAAESTTESAWAQFEVARDGTAVRLRESALLPDRLVRGQLTAGSPLVNDRHVAEYTLEGTPGLRLRLDLRSDAFDTVLRVIPPEGEPLTNDDAFAGTSNSRLDLSPNQQGTYRIQVTSYRTGETGEFELAYTMDTVAMQQFARAGTLGPASETVEGKRRSRYQIEAEAGSFLEVDLRSTAFDTYLVIRGPGGREWTNDDHAGSTQHSRLELALPARGVYTIIATSFSASEGGDYTLAVAGDGIERLWQPERIPARTERRTGELAPVGARHPRGGFQRIYTVSLMAGDGAVVDLRSTAFDTYLVVRAPNGQEWTNDDHEGSTSHSRVSFLAPVGGEYRIEATSFQAEERGPFELEWTIQPTDP